MFVAGNFYNSLCERLVACGRLNEDLLCADRAMGLHKQLLDKYFTYSGKEGRNSKHAYTLKDITMRPTVATKVWSSDCSLFDLEASCLGPWKVLQCYLESLLQVGVLYELLGDGKSAISVIISGANLSKLLKLPLIRISFHIVRGKILFKQRNLAKSLGCLKLANNLLQNDSDITCQKCKLILETSITQLIDAQSDLPTRENLYLSPLNLSKWKDLVAFESGGSFDDDGCLSVEMSNTKSLTDTINLRRLPGRAWSS